MFMLAIIFLAGSKKILCIIFTNATFITRNIFIKGWMDGFSLNLFAPEGSIYGPLT